MTASENRPAPRRRAARRRERSRNGAPDDSGAARLHGGASIYDVAARARVSVVTVSRVFNDYPHVSDAMRERVFTAARAVGYTPRLVSKRNLIAVVVGHLDHLCAGDYKCRLLLQLARAAAHRGYLIEFVPHDAIDLVTKHLADGLIEVGLTSDEVRALDRLPPVPRIAINKLDVDGAWSHVCSDHADETRIAMAHLQQRGHRRIALVLDEAGGWGVEARRRGYEESLARAGDPAFHPLVLFAAEQSPEDIARRIRDTRCTACLNLTDNKGFAVLDSLRNGLGLRVPDDLSVICLENTAISGYLSPPLTTVDQPLEEIARHAIGGLVDIIEGRGERFSVQVPSRLIERASVRGLK